MQDSTRARAWLRMAALYFIVGVTLGIVMGGSGDHSLTAVHAHFNLLGWVSMALIGVIATLFPAVCAGRVAAAQFWLHNLGLPVMMVALALRLKGNLAAEPVIGIASVVVGLSVLLFGWLVWTRVGTQAQRAQAAERQRAVG